MLISSEHQARNEAHKEIAKAERLSKKKAKAAGELMGGESAELVAVKPWKTIEERIASERRCNAAFVAWVEMNGIYARAMAQEMSE